jgi:hypothetical protein
MAAFQQKYPSHKRSSYRCFVFHTRPTYTANPVTLKCPESRSYNKENTLHCWYFHVKCVVAAAVVVVVVVVVVVAVDKSNVKTHSFSLNVATHASIEGHREPACAVTHSAE